MHCATQPLLRPIVKLIVFNILGGRWDKLFKVAQKMQTYDEMSTTKGHPLVPQDSQDYELRSPNDFSHRLKSNFNR